MITLSAAVISLVLAYSFASIGDLLLGRRSDTIRKGNQSFLTGLALTTMAFVPFSILLPGNALVVTALLLPIAGVSSLWNRLHGRDHSRGWNLLPVIHIHGWSIAFLIVIGLAFIQYNLQNLRLSYLWDGYQIWATKAMVIYHNGALSNQWVSLGDQERLVSYPHMVPLYEALIARVQGVFEWEALKPIFGLFYLSLLLSTFHAAECNGSQSSPA